MQYTTLEERREFYSEEFIMERAAKWLGKRIDRLRFAVIIGRHTQIFPNKYREDAETTIIIDEYKNLDDARDQIIEFLPESTYYDRNLYDEKGRKIGQELAFDIDPENLNCPIHGSLADKMKRGQGLSFCELELNMAKEQALSLYEVLENDFSLLRIVYSGRGFHIHVFDEEVYVWSDKKRQLIASEVKKKGFGIDEWVTAGEMRLIRLPFSLHGLVSRIVLPLEKSELEFFNPISDVRCIPKFLRGGISTSS